MADGPKRSILPGLFATGVSLGLALCANGAASRPPNIVVILTDDQGYGDIGVYGAKGYLTPNLDQLSRDGSMFTNFHVAQAVCSASRAALLTGCYPNRIGIHSALYPNDDVGLHPAEATMAKLLKRRGYATGMAGKWHLGSRAPFLPNRQGFDEYFGLPYSHDMWAGASDAKTRHYPPLPLYENDRVFCPDVTAKEMGNLTTWYTERAVSFIERHHDQPFFLYLAHSMPHVPLAVSDKFKGRSAQGLYGDVIMEIDWSVGEVLRALSKHRLENDTLVIFTSDNGPWLSYGDHAGSSGPLREGKGTSWEGGTRVPCLMRWPGHIPAGVVNGSFVMTIDLLPTIVHLAGAEMPARRIDGLDVWPLLTGQPEAANPHEGYGIWYTKNELQAVVSGDGRWKLVFPHRYQTLAGRKGGHGGVPVKYDMRTVETATLFDLRDDVGETRDVADLHPDVVQRLQDFAESCRDDLGDALTHREGRGVREPGRFAPEAGATKAPSSG